MKGSYSSNVVVSNHLVGSFLEDLVDFCKSQICDDEFAFVKRVVGNGSVCTNLKCMRSLDINAGEIVYVHVVCKNYEKADFIGKKIVKYLEGKEILKSNEQKCDDRETVSKVAEQHDKEVYSKPDMIIEDFNEQKEFMIETIKTQDVTIEYLMSIVSILRKNYPSIATDPEINDLFCMVLSNQMEVSKKINDAKKKKLL